MTESTPLQHLERISSGVAGLDTVLQGGFLVGGSYIIAGQPGAGKTTLSNQLCFAHVAAGGRAVYVSLLTETHDRLFLHLDGFNFFTREPIGDQIYYVSGMTSLENDGWRGLLELLRRVVREQRATLLVIDGVTFDTSVDDDLSLGQFLQRLQTHMATIGCSTFLVTHLSMENTNAPIYTMTDGIVELVNQRHQLRALREIEIRKLRGSAYLEGRHQMALTDAGVVVYPRTEQLYAQPAFHPDEPIDRTTWGVAELDRMTDGGLISGSTTMLLGPTGSGKTILSLHFLAAGAQAGEPSLHFGFYETPSRLRRKATQVGVPLDAAIDAGQLHTLWQPPLDTNIDALAQRLLATVEQHNIRRLFIDGVGGFEQAIDYADRLPRFFTALSQELRARGVTTLVAVELAALFGPTVEISLPDVSALSENLVFLRYVELQSQVYRLLSIIKMRESAYDSAIRKFEITSEGLKIDSTFTDAEAILTGVAHPHEENN